MPLRKKLPWILRRYGFRQGSSTKHLLSSTEGSHKSLNQEKTNSPHNTVNDEQLKSKPLKVNLTAAELKELLVESHKMEDKDSKHTNVENGTPDKKRAVEADESNKQEWSFTLYDCDGRGQVTKEDLANLMKSLYHAVGTSITRPHSGPKTVKLRLSVGPDEAKLNNSVDKNKPSIPVNKDTNKQLARRLQKQNNHDTAERLYGSLPNSPIHHHHSLRNNLHSDAVDVTKLASFELKHFENLRRSHIDKKRPKRHLSANDHNRDPRLAALRHDLQLDLQLPCTGNKRSPSTPESADRRKYYMDLAGVENQDAWLPVDDVSNDPLLPRRRVNRRKHRNASCSKAEINAENSRVKVRHTSRSRDRHGGRSWRNKSREQRERTRKRNVVHRTLEESKKENAKINFAKDACTGEVAVDNNILQGKMTSPNGAGKQRRHHSPQQLTLPSHPPDNVSPHHHRRHRNREKDRSQAMQQVLEWIEREHSGERADETHHYIHHIHHYHYH